MLRLMARAAATFHQRLKRGPATMRSFERRPAIIGKCWRILLQRPQGRDSLLAMRRMRGVAVTLLLWCSSVAAGGAEEKQAPPFRLGTFELQGRTFVGQVREDQGVIDIAAADAALEKSHPAWPKVKPPADMKDLIARYEGIKARLHAISRELAAARGPYVHEMKALKIRPPIVYPETM